MYGGDCAQFIPKLLATDIRKAVTATRASWREVNSRLIRAQRGIIITLFFFAPGATGALRRVGNRYFLCFFLCVFSFLFERDDSDRNDRTPRARCMLCAVLTFGNVIVEYPRAGSFFFKQAWKMHCLTHYDLLPGLGGHYESDEEWEYHCRWRDDGGILIDRRIDGPLKEESVTVF